MDPCCSNPSSSKKRGRARPSMMNMGVSKGKGKPANKSFHRRKQGLKKKISELTILCGAEACFIFMEPSDCNSASKEGISNETIEVWPDMAKAREMVDKYKGMSANDQNKNKMDSSNPVSQSMNMLKKELASRMIQNINLLKQELAIKRKENMDLQTQLMTPQSLDMLISMMPAKNIETLVQHIDKKLDAVNARVQFLTNQYSDPNYHEPASLCDDNGYMGRVNGRGGHKGLENVHISQMSYPTQFPLHQHHHQSLHAPHHPQMHDEGNMNCNVRNWSNGQVNCGPYPWLVEKTICMDIGATMTSNSSVSLTEDAHFHNLLPSY